MALTAWILSSVLLVVVGVGLKPFVPVGPNQGLVQLSLALTAVSCYLVWVSAYLAQMNPLFGPQLNNLTLSLMNKDMNSTHYKKVRTVFFLFLFLLR